MSGEWQGKILSTEKYNVIRVELVLMIPRKILKLSDQ